MFITEGFTRNVIKKYPNFFEGHYFIIQLRNLSNERLIGKLSKLNDGKVTFEDMYNLEDVHIFNPTSTIIYGFLAFKNKEAEEENRKKIIESFDQMNVMLRGLSVIENSVYGDFGAKES